MVDARAGPGTKSFVKTKSKKVAKHIIKTKIVEEEMEVEPRKDVDNQGDISFGMENVTGLFYFCCLLAHKLVQSQRTIKLLGKTIKAVDFKEYSLSIHPL